MQVNTKNIIIIFFTIAVSCHCGNAVIWDTVPEGHVGIYYRLGGKLMEHTSEPGFYLKAPWPVTAASEIQITPQTDVLHNVECGAKDGTQLYFKQVEVGNHLKKDSVYSTVKRFTENYDTYLIKDKVRHQINVICSSLNSQEIYIEKFDTLDDELKEFLQKENDKENSGVIVDFVRLSKPTLPKTLQDNYDKIANEKTAREVAIQTQKRLEQEQKNKIMVAEKEAERDRIIAENKNQMALDKKKADEHMAEIENRIALSKAKTTADSIYVKKQKEANGNKLLLTNEYVELEKTRAMGKNAKHYFGQIPNTLFIKDTEFTHEDVTNNICVGDENVCG